MTPSVQVVPMPGFLNPRVSEPKVSLGLAERGSWSSQQPCEVEGSIPTEQLRLREGEDLLKVTQLRILLMISTMMMMMMAMTRGTCPEPGAVLWAVLCHNSFK